MKRNNELANKIRDKILQDGTIVSEKYVDNLINRIFDMCPQELESNIWEWVEDKPYSDIKYCGLSINDLVDLGYNKNYFFKLVNILSLLKTRYNGDYRMSTIKLIYDTNGYWW